MFSLPNILTYLRILIIPLIVVSFYLPTTLSYWVGTGLYIIATVSDFFDGYLARKMKLESEIGKFLDPIADKLLICAILFMLVKFDRANEIAAIIIVFREIFISGLREHLAKQEVDIAVTFIAKIKTTIQMVAIGIPLMGYSNYITDGLIWLAAALTFITGYQYFKASFKYLIK